MFISFLALATPHLRRLDVRGCRFITPTAVAKLAETMRDSRDGQNRLEAIGIDQPLRPPGVDGPGEGGYWDFWSAWRWLEFTQYVSLITALWHAHPSESTTLSTLMDQEEWTHRRRFYKDKKPVRPLLEPRQPLTVRLPAGPPEQPPIAPSASIAAPDVRLAGGSGASRAPKQPPHAMEVDLALSPQHGVVVVGSDEMDTGPEVADGRALP